MPTKNIKTNINVLVTSIKRIKWNIPINVELLNKYDNVTKLMNNEINNYDCKIYIKNDTSILNDTNLSKINRTEAYHLAKKIFNDYNDNNIFNNSDNQIFVSNADIKESINKIFNNNKQRKFLKEHFQVFSNLRDVIENSSLVNQTLETKNRKDNIIWNYYPNVPKINDENYLFEFDVLSMANGENHYRVQRLQKKTNVSAGNIAESNITPTLETFVSTNNIAQSNNEVKHLF